MCELEGSGRCVFHIRHGFSCRGLQPPQMILSSLSNLYIQGLLYIAWHSGCHCMVSSRPAMYIIGLKQAGFTRWLVVHPEHGCRYE